MLGAIAGDTVGSVYEFDYNKDYNFRLMTERSIYTDDSIMTVAVAKWLLEDPEHTHQKLEDAMVEFGKKFPNPMGGYGGSFAMWLFRPDSLKSYDESLAPPYESSTGRIPYGSCGNGSGMRAGAIGWFFDSLEKTEDVAKISAEITHNHPEGIKGAQATAAAVWMARNGHTKAQIKEYIERKYGYDLSRTYKFLNDTYGWESTAQKTTPEAIIAFLESNSFEDAIRKAVSLGGDADTIACMTGAIAEAYYGDVPEPLASQVEERLDSSLREVLERMRRETAYGSIHLNPALVSCNQKQKNVKD